MSDISLEDRHISSSLIEKILSVKNNSLVKQFFDVYKVAATGRGIKNVTVNKAGEMTFLPKGKDSILSTDADSPLAVWKKDGRQSGSFGKVLRKLLVETGTDPKSINNSELEEIVNALKAHYTIEGTFEIVSGSDITFYYYYENYDESFNCGTMESSCMRHGGACQDACELYANNPDTCEMVILKSPLGNMSRGRALLWTDKDGKKWMDRIYANDSVTTAFKHFAHSNGWPHKQSQDCCAATWVFPDGSAEARNIYIKMDTDYWPKPYVDTMCYVGDGTMTNDSSSGLSYTQSEPDDDGVYDEYDDCYISEEVATYLEYRDCYTHQDNAFYCDIEDSSYLRNDSIELHDGTLAFNESNSIIQAEDGQWYHEDDVAWCSHNDEYYPSGRVEYIADLDISVYEPSINDAYESAGWVLNDEEVWVDPQYIIEIN